MLNMKKILIIEIIIISFVALSKINSEYVGNYYRTAEVKANYNGWVVVLDDKGHYWHFDDNGRHLEIGEVVELKVNDNGTEKYIDDDIIKNIKRK